MMLENLQTLTLATSIGFLLAQLFVKNKQTTHILFAIFCGSIAMYVAKGLSGNTLGAYQYLVGLGACVTCNGYWLLSRSLFRTSNAISFRHLLLASSIALLIMLNQGVLFAQSQQLLLSAELTLFPIMIREFIVILSSCILVLSAWEGVRGFSEADKQQKAQRLFFLATFGIALIVSRAAKSSYIDDANSLHIVITGLILFVLINTQLLIIWISKTQREKQLVALKHPEVQSNNKTDKVLATPPKRADESELARKIESLIQQQALYLQMNLKVADLARLLDAPEYRVSNALRYHLNARNFNQFINEYRIEHAKCLLSDPNKKAWSVVVVSIESGFASVGPFTRTFKTITGLTPNQFRQDSLAQS